MVTIGTLNGGNITITSGGSTPATRTATRVWYGNDESVYTEYEISGSIYSPGKNEDDDILPTEQIPNVTSAKKIEIGTSVTNIGYGAFCACVSLINLTIPNSVTSIGNYAFGDCSGLTSVTFEGKDKATVQGMTNYPFGLDSANEDGVTIHFTDEDIQVQYEAE